MRSRVATRCRGWSGMGTPPTVTKRGSAPTRRTPSRGLGYTRRLERPAERSTGCSPRLPEESDQPCRQLQAWPPGRIDHGASSQFFVLSRTANELWSITLQVQRDGRQFTVEVRRPLPSGRGLTRRDGAAGRGRRPCGADRGALTDELGDLRRRRSAHDGGRVLRDLAVMLADGGDALCDRTRACPIRRRCSARSPPTDWS